MSKQMWGKVVKIFKVFVKLLAGMILVAFFTMDYFFARSITKWQLYVYVLVMFVCAFSFFLTFVEKVRKAALVVFFVSLAIYVWMDNFVPEIVIVHKIEECVDSGNVWDDHQNICRDDCWHWNEEQGCFPLMKDDLVHEK